MGLWNVLTAPARFAAHVAGGAASRAGNHMTGNIAANAALSKARFQLRSYEGKELFDSKQLAAHVRQFKKVLHIMMKHYGGVNKHGESDYVHSLIAKAKGNSALLEKLQAEAVATFTGYYHKLLEIMSQVEIDQADLTLQENAALIKDEKGMGKLIADLDGVRKGEHLTFNVAEFSEVLDALKKKVGGQEVKDARVEIKERTRFEKGKDAVRGWARFVGHVRGINFVAHKARKLSKQVMTHDYRKFHQHFNELQSEIGAKQVTPATLTKLKFLLKNYEGVRKYYHEIDQDMILIMQLVFEGFDELSKECVVPLYTALRSVKGADKLLEVHKQVLALHQKYNTELAREEFEIKAVYKALQELVAECETVVTNARNENAGIIKQVQQQMAGAT
ncbi:hypothetical protein HN419_00875 [Candidatus Woesearchaeota archaeon]|jgi:hypothetical protein|nr:hypothetical protein [Candidatus Woesearchaeota archaeon]MBT3537449.1 hypothetical protein [Candidatus Woesearchaeota archaeon]MBT4696953.1 hypothetical protein [Candidatus Woesearchaeota archaeon]MBT4717563.1 hypothetical protein [Candidatus Woesearchaeota archaeon]MBT7106241.1 hypothetical protein [Candidatus Woesearchaeota archaeon]